MLTWTIQVKMVVFFFFVSICYTLRRLKLYILSVNKIQRLQLVRLPWHIIISLHTFVLIDQILQFSTIIISVFLTHDLKNNSRLAFTILTWLDRTWPHTNLFKFIFHQFNCKRFLVNKNSNFCFLFVHCSKNFVRV